MQRSQRFVADQRFDLPHYKGMIGYIEDSFQDFNRAFVSSSNYIVRNWQIESLGGLVVRVNPSSESSLFITERVGFEDLIIRKTTEDILTHTLADNAVNYVEVQVFEETCANDTVAIWDATANSGVGQEFAQNVDLVKHQQQRIISNTTAFSADGDKIPLAMVTTAGGSIVSIADARPFLFHLSSDYNFGSPRTDKGIHSIKQMYDAITTVVKEMKQSPTWYEGNTIGLLDIVERLNYMMVDGGTISWDLVPNTLSWSSTLRIIAPSRSFDYSVAAQSITSVADGDVVYVTLPDEGVAPGGPLTVFKTNSSSYVINSQNTRNYILAYRSGSRIYFGNGWMGVELESGEQNQLGDGITQAWITATGLTDENDSTPPYTSTNLITAGGSFTLAISELDSAINTLLVLVTGPVYTQTILVPAGGYPVGTQITLPAAQTYQVGFNQLEVYFNGVFAQSGAGQDYLEVNDGGGVGTKIQTVYALPEGMKVTFRIQIGGSGSFAGSFDVYDEGSPVALAVTKMNFVGDDINVTSPGLGEVTVAVTASAPSRVEKRLRNNSGVSILANKAVAFDDFGNIVLADANSMDVSDFAGITAETILNGSFGRVIKLGNCPGAATSLGASFGQLIYLGETPGELQLIAPSGLSDTIIALGRAEPPDGSVGAAVDLFLDPQIIAEP